MVSGHALVLGLMIVPGLTMVLGHRLVLGPILVLGHALVLGQITVLGHAPVLRLIIVLGRLFIRCRLGIRANRSRQQRNHSIRGNLGIHSQMEQPADT